MISDERGRLLWCGATRPGRMHDVTALRTEGIEDLLRRYPTVRAKVDSGYQGLARDFPGQVSAPPKKPPKDACEAQRTEYNTVRKAQSSHVRSAGSGLETHRQAALGRADIEAFLHRLSCLQSVGKISGDARIRACREIRAVLTRPGGPGPLGMGPHCLPDGMTRAG